MANQSLIRTKIEHAKHQLWIAEKGLADSLHEIRELPHEASAQISEVAERAFETLRDARQHLANLESLLAATDDDS